MFQICRRPFEFKTIAARDTMFVSMHASISDVQLVRSADWRADGTAVDFGNAPAAVQRNSGRSVQDSWLFLDTFNTVVASPRHESPQTVLMPDKQSGFASSALCSMTLVLSRARLPVVVCPARHNAVKMILPHLCSSRSSSLPLCTVKVWVECAVSAEAVVQAAAGCVQKLDFTAARWCWDSFRRCAVWSGSHARTTAGRGTLSSLSARYITMYIYKVQHS